MSMSQTTQLTQTQKSIVEFARTTDKTYLKSKYIADKLDLSSRCVGLNIRQIQKKADVVEVEIWGSTSGSTWVFHFDGDQNE